MNISRVVRAAAMVGLLASCEDSARGGGTPIQDPPAGETLGAESNPTGDPIGGGAGYRRVVAQGDYTAGTSSELLAALQSATAGQVVYVDAAAVIDLTGLQGITVPAGVTLAGGRGRDGSAGALIFSTQFDTWPLFETGGDGVRVTGLRLRGPDPERRTNATDPPAALGILTSHAGLEVDNCELSAWGHAAVWVGGVLSRGAGKAYIHHNSMHHNQREGLGYGVVLLATEALIEANLFDWNRHHIAGTGQPLSGYEARYNICRENANSHNFDMHGGADRGDGTDIAGDRIWIHHNTFQASDHIPVLIRGIPRVGAEVHHNWFVNRSPSTAVYQVYDWGGDFRVYDNAYGADRTVVASEEVSH